MKQIKKRKQTRLRAVGEHMLRPNLPSEAYSAPADANTRPDLCCRLGKVSHLHSTHDLHTATNPGCTCVHRSRRCSLCCFCIFMSACFLFCCLCFSSKMCIYITYNFITEKLKPHEGFNLATFSEQLMCRSQVKSADSALYLKPNTSLCPPPTIIPTSLSSSVLYNLLLSSPPLFSTQNSPLPMKLPLQYLITLLATDQCWFCCILLLDTQDLRPNAFSHSITQLFLLASLPLISFVLFFITYAFTHWVVHSFSCIMCSVLASSRKWQTKKDFFQTSTNDKFLNWTFSALIILINVFHCELCRMSL